MSDAKPNLFTFASSELSQDAFICWFLSWSDKRCEMIDSKLHTSSIELLKALFRKHDKSLPSEIENIEVIKQHQNIDVLCIVNNQYRVLIEDKTFTSEHSNQLQNYIDKLMAEPKVKREDILPIYFKTGDQSSYQEVIKRGYKPFLRSDFIKILNAGIKSGIENEIYVNYASHLKSIEQKVDSYQFFSIDQWCEDSWVGFYKRLQKELNTGAWDYVPNKRGGFWGFWWGSQLNKDKGLYLQIEQDVLCLKTGVKNRQERSKVRNYWHSIVDKNALNADLGFVRPNRFGNGMCMTVAILSGGYIQTDKSNIIDIEKTLAILTKAENFLESVIN